ncbi:cytochrome c oxidase assembly protein subunit 15 [Bryocella elongata]|uniref:Cytochrome c oxidase assembly protein subunit 15 n=1 Tax=Bryocella elongata TaxID=863522 RepID=A0A1H5ZRQ9_9BACT|nr:COX15/CtaA family protein [Bryocella elongata]SEG38086.1 cytochrome c oxidase assembly protein subunit 15 [Bryocella elongata]
MRLSRNAISWLREGRWLSKYAALVLGFMVVVILEGAVVRATGSGAGCGQHWPLCNGQIIPHHPRVATIIEFAHRSLTGILSTLVITLALWTFFSRPKGHPARRAMGWTLVLLLVEALLGAVLVLGQYVEHNTSNARVFVQGIHFTNTMLLLAALTLTWWWSADREEDGTPLPPETRTVAWVAVLASILTGAAGSVAALADTLFPSTSFVEGLRADLSPTAPLLIRMRWIHPTAAVIAFVCALWFMVRLRTTPARWFAALMALQLVLGAMDVVLLAPLWLQVAHLAVADAVWAALIVACSHLLIRRPAPALQFAIHTT